VSPGLLKISAPAGFPEYVDPYLFAEQATLCKQAVKMAEVGNAAASLLSLQFSGVDAQQTVLDARMSTNYSDRDTVRRCVEDGPSLSSIFILDRHDFYEKGRSFLANPGIGWYLKGDASLGTLPAEEAKIDRLNGDFSDGLAFGSVILGRC
jgi:hypothetical protein